MIVLGGLPREVKDGLSARGKRGGGVTRLSWLNNWQKCSTLQEVSRGTGRQAPIAKSFGQTCSLFQWSPILFD